MLARETFDYHSRPMREKYEVVIGLEVHAQLKTDSKIFCGCSTHVGDEPNSNTCAVCLGLPGALPVLNGRVVELATRTALALNLQINEESIFARKNYFYPDLPKGYQISQYTEPFSERGWVEILTGDRDDTGHARDLGSKRFGITRMHLEEDAGKSIHDGMPDSDTRTYVDLNRSGTPLAEIVSEPDFRSSWEAYDYVQYLRRLLQYVDTCDANMEEGNLRCDANVSVRPFGQEQFGTKVELKNLNSVRFLQRALEYEIDRQIAVVESGGSITQETRLWSERENRTYSMRSKEDAHDYRYFPEPDLPPLRVPATLVERVRAELPELPEAIRLRFGEEYGLSLEDATVLSATRELAALLRGRRPALRESTGERQLDQERALARARGALGRHRELARIGRGTGCARASRRIGLGLGCAGEGDPPSDDRVRALGRRDRGRARRRSDQRRVRDPTHCLRRDCCESETGRTVPCGQGSVVRLLRRAGHEGLEQEGERQARKRHIAREAERDGGTSVNWRNHTCSFGL